MTFRRKGAVERRERGLLRNPIEKASEVPPATSEANPLDTWKVDSEVNVQEMSARFVSLRQLPPALLAWITPTSLGMVTSRKLPLLMSPALEKEKVRVTGEEEVTAEEEVTEKLRRLPTVAVREALTPPGVLVL